MLNLGSAALRVFLAVEPCDTNSSMPAAWTIRSARKRWLGSRGSTRPTNAAPATFSEYTLIGNGLGHGLNAEEYVEEVIRRLPVDATEEQAAELTPARIAAARQQAAAVHTA